MQAIDILIVLGIALFCALALVRYRLRTVAPPHRATPMADPSLDRELRAILGRPDVGSARLAAIRHVRERTGWRLREAIDYVKTIERGER